ncbi:hypothetical protein [Nostoc sp. NZL]|nr:hypothetical protein [Nostoc sp. NZL]
MKPYFYVLLQLENLKLRCDRIIHADQAMLQATLDLLAEVGYRI